MSRFGHTPSRRGWSREEVRLLRGPRSDQDIAELTHRPLAEIRWKRRNLGHVWSPAERWTAKEIALLGTRTDIAVARLLSRSHGSVRSKRAQLHIAPFLPRPKWRRWTAK